MPSGSRRRPEAEFEQASNGLGKQNLVIAAMSGGVNGYTSPELMSPQFWAAASNIYSGQFATIRRPRWARILTAATSGYFTNANQIASLFGFAAPLRDPALFFDYEVSGATPGFTKTSANLVVYPTFLISQSTPSASLIGPYMSLSPVPIMILRSNGLVRTKYYLPPNTDNFFLEFWGIDTPDSSPGITLAAGQALTIATITRTANTVTIVTTAPLTSDFISGNYFQVAGVVTAVDFNNVAGTSNLILTASGSTLTYQQVGANEADTTGTISCSITKTVGRSYQWAWENSNTTHVSAPSPASQYVVYANQTGTIDLLQPGTVSAAGGTVNIVGTNTQFSQSWVGRTLWVETVGGGSVIGDIQAVTDATHLATDAILPAFSTKVFQVYDRQSTHVRLYETGDGGSVFFRTARNTFDPTQLTRVLAGLEFVDTSNSEPPNAPFTSEITQNFNVPPPIGAYQQDYQGRDLVFGVPAALQSFFYSNMETTLVGQPTESFGPLNNVTLPISGELRAMANLPTGCIIWSNRHDMFKLSGLLSDNTVSNSNQLGATIQKLPYAIGAASAYATAVTSLGAFWLSSDRQVWLFTDHYAPKNVGTPIQDVLNTINGARLKFAKMKYYKNGDKNWLVLAIATGSSTFNNQICALDLDLLASNGQPSFFTFDMATNQPSWYLYNVNCEAISTGFDDKSNNHFFAGDVNLITDLDWQTTYYTIGGEISVPSPSITLHALGNEAPHVIKQINWIRCNTNATKATLQSLGWTFAILAYDDDNFQLGVNPQTITLTPGTQNYPITGVGASPPDGAKNLEYGPGKFSLSQGQQASAKGRRFQLQVNFPSAAGFFEFRSFQVEVEGKTIT